MIEERLKRRVGCGLDERPKEDMLGGRTNISHVEIDACLQKKALIDEWETSRRLNS